MRLAVLTSTETRHRYFVNALRRRLNVGAVCYQDTGYVPAESGGSDIDADSRRIVQMHFAERAVQEERFFGRDAEAVADSPACRVRQLTVETLNTPATLEFLQVCGVEAVAVYGTSLIKEPLLGAYVGRMINMHLGLSPYYRGTATNFYPLVNDEPEYVGATIHLIDEGIDSGPIIYHARPEITADDMPHTVGCKTILAGIERVVQAFEDLENGTLKAIPQWKPPRQRLYLRKDYKPDHVVQLYRLIDEGLFSRYVERKGRVEKAVELVS